MVPVFYAQLGAISEWVPRRAFQPHAQARFAVDIPEQASLSRILRYDQVDAAIAVEVSDGRAALFAIDQNTAFLAGHGT